MSNQLVGKNKTNEFLHKINSLNIAPGKGACINFQTSYKTGDFIYYKSTKEIYKRTTKYGIKGNYKRKKWWIFESYYDTLCEAWKDISANYKYTDWLQTSTGLNHTVRNVIILDFDANKYMPNGFGYTSVQEAYTDVFGFVSRYQMPHPNYIYYNKTSGNIQVGWFLDIALLMYKEDERSTYLSMGKAISHMWSEYKGMPGDLHFTGWQCKNPFNTNKTNGSVVFSEESIDTLDLIQATKPYWKKKEPKKKFTIKITRKGSGQHFDNIETSRDAYESVKLREWVWSYMRKYCEEPTFEMAMDKTYELAEEASIVTGKPQHEYQELESICRSTWKWAIKHFNPDFVSYTDEQRRFAYLYNQTQRYYKYLQNKQLKGTCRSKANVIGCSASTVSRLDNLTESQVDNLKKAYQEFKELIDELNTNYYKANKKNKYIILLTMIDKINEIKEIIKIKVKEIKTNIASLRNILYNNRDETKSKVFREIDWSPGGLAELALKNSA